MENKFTESEVLEIVKHAMENSPKKKLSEMTKKHYWLFVSILVHIADEAKRNEIIDYLIKVFKQDNPKFNATVFKNAIAKALQNPGSIPVGGVGGGRPPMAKTYEKKSNKK